MAVDPNAYLRVPVENWPRWRFINLWRKFDLFGNPGWSFSVFNCWFNGQFCGVAVFNFAIEYNRHGKDFKGVLWTF